MYQTKPAVLDCFVRNDKKIALQSRGFPSERDTFSKCLQESGDPPCCS